jgi:2,4-dienoyl-CoA reductase-like NADH-dependent reductase (Old Yellow Enzyme family)
MSADPSPAGPAPLRKTWPIPPECWPTREEARRSLLFSPGRLGCLDTRTRTWVPAMVPWRATEEGYVTRDVLDWYGRFALGRPGVLVVEATGIRDIPSGPLLRIGHDRFLPGLCELVRVVREASGGTTRLLIQLIDFLAVKRRPEKARYLMEFLRLRPEHRRALEQLPQAPVQALEDERSIRSALLELTHETLLSVLSPRERQDLEFGYRERVDDVHLAHVAELPRVLPAAFAAAARRARESGFDGVELHFAHAYTMASFLSRTNQRRDGYGGSPEGRLRLPVEVVRAVRAELGSDYVVGCRMLGDEIIAGGSRVEDASVYAEGLARAGLDFLSISTGGKFDDAKQPKVGEAVYPYTGRSGHECMPSVRIDPPGESGSRGPFGRHLPAAAAIRAHVRARGFGVPVVAAGGIAGFRLAEEALARGACDFVASARQSLADPDWWLKVEEGRGDRVRRCLMTNYCEALDQRHEQVTCQLWDRDFELSDPRPRVADEPVARSRDGKRRLIAPPSES